ncbi:MAG TPA: peptidoglycan DD-metalloendopeptidase family protein, partial [Myxococcota bacterium]|nr:peptidoglycan DD-metalloendopeptidase family protein [Myxococcota bacterium]
MSARLAAAALALVLAACAAPRPAPVVDRMPAPAPVPAPAEGTPPPEAPLPAAGSVPTHTVKRGETMVGIALQHGLDYRDLAAWNYITNPNQLAVGQVLVVAPPPGVTMAAGSVATPLATVAAPIEARPLANTPTLKVEPRGEKVPFSERALAQFEAESAAVAPPAAPPAAAPEKPAGTDREDVDWMWPVKGKVLAPFTEASKGVDIGGRKGAPVVAAAAGRVVYAGAGLRGYGKLVIIKHSNTWLSAYAHNDNLLVKEQQ